MEIDLKQMLHNLGLAKDEFQNNVIVVTGAGHGIGLQIARAFAMLGGKVVIAELSEEGINAEECIRAEAGDAFYIHTDVSDASSVAHLAEKTHARFGPVDFLINNAILCPVARVAEMDEKLWDRVIAVNLRGTFLVSKAFLPDMLARKSGIIVNMVSAEAMPGLSAYIASKQGIVGFSQSLDLELEASNIQVIAFAPGMVDTPGIRATAPALAPLLGMTEEQFLTTPLHAAYDGLMPPEHAGVAAIYLVARLAKEAHGQVINGYEVLEKAGVLNTPLAGQAEEKETLQHLVDADALGTIKQLEAILVETEAELNKLPAFIRPIARNGFKSKSGQSLPDWQRSVSTLRSETEAGHAFIRSSLPALLRKLAIYYRDVPKETSRFTKDAEFLHQVGETCRQRMAIIGRLIQLLE
jgi:NAD(P)-dependent dehydrogenase (short-subunit alcohol dehydrogenase family)